MVGLFLDGKSEQHFQELVVALDGGQVAVLIGAGLSVGAKPGWEALHKHFREMAAVSDRYEFEPRSAPADFSIFREALGEQEFFTAVKQVFGGPEPDHPQLELYKTLCDIEGIESLITTNYDELLYMAARASEPDPQVSEYPKFRGRSERYIYLHGRAKSAGAIKDLVLCQEEYAEAYDDRGPAIVELQTHLRGHLLFVGSSLDDPDLAGVLRAHGRLRYTRKTAVSEPTFVLQRAEEGWTDEDAAIAMRRAELMHNRPILFRYDENYTTLRAVLEELRSKAGSRTPGMFYLDQVGVVDGLAVLEDPSDADKQRLIELIGSSPPLRKHFFRQATSAAWYPALLAAGLLEAVVEPWPDSEGQIHVKSWDPAPYIQHLASTHPDGIAELISRLRDSKNWQMHGVLSGLAWCLSDDQLGEALPVLRDWRHLEFPYAGLDLNFTTLFVRVANSGYTSAFGLLEELLGPHELVRAMESYHVEQVDPAVQKLIGDAPEKTLHLLMASLAASLDEDRQGWFSRAAIEEHEQNATQMHPMQHARVSWTREALSALCRSDPEAGTKELNALNASGEDLLVRLALHIARTLPGFLGRLESPFVTFERVFDHALYHEMMLLLHERFHELPDDEQETVHRAVREGPPLLEGETEGDRRGRIDSWRRHLLGIISVEHQTAQEGQWRTDLGVTPDAEEQSFFLAYSTSGWVAETIDEPGLQAVLAQGTQQLLAYMREEPRRWRGLRQLAQADPQGLLSVATHFAPPDFRNLSYFLEAYGELAKSGVSFSWTPLIDLCERIVGMPQGLDEYQFSAVARLLRNGLGTQPENQGVPQDLRARALGTCASILSSEAVALAEGLPPNTESTSHQLNSAAGEAAEALLWYLESETARSEAGQGIPVTIRGHVERALSEGWGGVEMRHALGRFAARLEWFEPGWVERNLPALFPDDESASSVSARRAFVNGYLIRQPVTGLMRTLHGLYRAVIPDTGREEPLYLDDRRQTKTPFTQHIVVGWLWHVDGFGLDGLLGELLGAADEEALENIVWFLGSAYANSTDAGHRADLWGKMDVYWQHRVEASQSLNISESSGELTRFCLWVRETDVPLPVIEERLVFCIGHMDPSYGLHALLEGLSKRAACEPAAVSRVLQRVVDKWSTLPDLAWSADKLEEALDSLCAAAGADEAASIEQIVLKLHQDANIDFRDKLTAAGSSG